MTKKQLEKLKRDQLIYSLRYGSHQSYPDIRVLLVVRGYKALDPSVIGKIARRMKLLREGKVLTCEILQTDY